MSEQVYPMPHYIAIVEEAGPETAVGVWFPDLPGCFSAGDDLDEALRNALEAIRDSFFVFRIFCGEPVPTSPENASMRSRLLKRVARDIQDYMVALVPVPARADAAE